MQVAKPDQTRLKNDDAASGLSVRRNFYEYRSIATQIEFIEVAYNTAYQ